MDPRQLLVLSNCACIGHRICLASVGIIKQKFIWKITDKNVTNLVEDCIHFIVSSPGQVFPLPIQSALHERLPHEVVHAEYFNMGKMDDCILIEKGLRIF